jgi:hypothetical protein
MTYIFINTIPQECTGSSEEALCDLKVYMVTVPGIPFVALSDIYMSLFPQRQTPVPKILPKL